MEQGLDQHGKRCVIWFGRAHKRDSQVLASLGWGVRNAAISDDPQIGLRGNEEVVAFVDLGSRPAESAQLIEHLRRTHLDLPVVAVIDPAAAVDDALRVVLTTCTTQVSLPLQAERTSKALHDCAQWGGKAASKARKTHAIDMMLGDSTAMLDVNARLHQFAPIALPVTISGETGTGKELAARAIHELSPRSVQPFITVNCGALPAGLVQSELFGHERGALTGATSRRIGHFESAHGGTIFLDEIGDLPLEAQVNLLRVLQEGHLQRVGGSQSIKVDVRVIAATHVDLQRAVAEGKFREDLLFRIDVLRVVMPPLRARGDDGNVLARSFLTHFRTIHGNTIARGFSPEARQRLANHDWPGNVRELLNRVRRAAVIATQSLITPADLELDQNTDASGGLGSARANAERDTLLETLRDTGYNVSACARRLRISRVTVYRLCKKHGLSLDDLRR